MGNKGDRALAGASLFLTLAVLAWGIVGCPRFARIGPMVKPRTKMAARADYANTNYRALASPAAEERGSAATARGGNGKVLEAASAGVPQDESFRIIGVSEGDGGKVWFLKGRSSGVVIAAGEAAKSGYAFSISEDRAWIAAAGTRYRVEGE